MPAISRRGFGVVLVFGLLAACGTRQSAAPGSGVTALQIVDLQPGNGAVIAAGQKAVMNYTGWLFATSAPDNKGKQFDSSRDGGKPFRFDLGAGQVIKGWDQGIVGMKVGGRRRLVIPAPLAYGDNGAGGVIPPGATLIFDVDLLAIE
jgi:FKBP-type peptidyl-prolyl cis-trans isomerase FkpA